MQKTNWILICIFVVYQCVSSELKIKKVQVDFPTVVWRNDDRRASVINEDMIEAVEVSGLKKPFANPMRFRPDHGRFKITYTGGWNMRKTRTFTFEGWNGESMKFIKLKAKSKVPMRQWNIQEFKNMIINEDVAYQPMGTATNGKLYPFFVMEYDDPAKDNTKYQAAHHLKELADDEYYYDDEGDINDDNEEDIEELSDLLRALGGLRQRGGE